MNWIWQRDPTVCGTCEHPTRLHNTSGCIMPQCACEWAGRARSYWAQVIGAVVILALITWVLR